MKICWITENYVDVDFPIIKELDKYIKIDWIISHHKSAAFYSDNDYLNMRNSINGNIKIYKTSNRNRNPLNIFHYFKIINEIKKSNSDIIYLNILGFPYFHILLYFFYNHPFIIYAAHDVIEHSGIKNRNLLIQYKKFIFKIYKYFQTFSETQNNKLLSLYPQKKSFVGRLFLKNYSTFEVIHSEKSISVEKNNFLFFGKIRPNKGVDLLIKAANNLSKKYKDNFKVTIAGNSQNWADYEDLIEDSSVFDLQIGFIPNEQIQILFNKADYIVLPYRDMTQSGVLMVAYNYNVPAIASNHKEFSNDIVHKKTGLLFENENVIELQTLMENVILGKINSENIRNNLKQYISDNISASAISKLYKNFFLSLLNDEK